MAIARDMNIGFSFDEAHLRDALSELHERLVGTFAVTCAQRLFPSLVKYFSLRDKPDPALELYEECLAVGWSLAVGGGVDRARLGYLLTGSEREAPETDASWVAGFPYAQDAAIAICYALRSFGLDGVESAVLSAQTAYIVADNVAMRGEVSEIITDEVENRVRNHPAVQNELSRQRRDVEELQLLQENAANWDTAIAACRLRSRVEADVFFEQTRIL
jgi:hypothetical protein